MRALYVVASTVLFAILAPFLAVFRKTRDGWAQRFGFYAPGLIPTTNGPRIWLHGASAGDLLALSPMIDRLRTRFPDAVVVLSTMTNSGYLMATERLKKKVDVIIYSPWDLWGATRRAMAAVKPSLLVLEYTEIWPNLIRAAKRQGARIALTNGRFSPAHLSRYRAFFAAIENPLLDLDVLLMREPEEAERALSLGAPADRVVVTGNTKFDTLATQTLGADESLRVALGLAPEELVWICGSTHDGEEGPLLEVFRKLRETHRSLKLVIAPRYIDRADRVLGLIAAANLEGSRRSQGGGTAVVVLDSIGELARAYRLGTIVFVGGSFTTRGGQNILEPAGQGRPVLFGPHMENFRDSVQVLVGRGGIQVNDPEHLFRVMSELLAQPGAVERLGQMAEAAVRQVSGASDRNVEVLAKLIEKGR